jgi:Holliday junction resolvase RusA-like endonuclease
MTKRAINLTLPFPPYANNLYRTLMMERKGIPGPATIEGRAVQFLERMGGRALRASDLIAFAKNEVDRIQAIRVPSGEAKKYKTAVSKICSLTNMNQLLGDVAVSLSVYRPRRAGDLDGTFKAIFDSLTGFAWADDKQIGAIQAVRFEDKHQPRVEIGINPIGAEQDLFAVAELEEIPR